MRTIFSYTTHCYLTKSQTPALSSLRKRQTLRIHPMMIIQAMKRKWVTMKTIIKPLLVFLVYERIMNRRSVYEDESLFLLYEYCNEHCVDIAISPKWVVSRIHFDGVVYLVYPLLLATIIYRILLPKQEERIGSSIMDLFYRYGLSTTAPYSCFLCPFLCPSIYISRIEDCSYVRYQETIVFPLYE